MRYGLCMANIGTYGDPRVTVDVAVEAETSGWDGVFLWDHLGFVWDGPAADPWTTLAAIAVRTERIRIGTAVTPVARRRPHVLAHQVATVDVLSGGRVIFGAGLGGAQSEFAKFGDETDAKTRAVMLDEGLQVLRALWSGDEVHHRGAHYTVDGVTLAPARREIPIWIGGNTAPALRRAARYDGWCADSADPEGKKLPPDAIARGLRTIGRESNFDVAVIGRSDRWNPDHYAQAGATWWLERVDDRAGSAAELRALVRSGPHRT